MTNKRTKKILAIAISLICIAAIVTISFAAWDTKSGEHQFSADGGKNVKVTASGDSTFNKTLYPDGLQPVDANGKLAPSDAHGLYIYATFSANYVDKNGNVTTDASYIKGSTLRWKFSELKVDRTSILNADLSAIADNSVFDAWVADTATYERPAGNSEVAMKTGTIKAGTTYYFVMRFKTATVKEYTHTDNKTYKFYSDGTFNTSASATKLPINAANLSSIGLPFYSNTYTYAAAPFTTEKLDTGALMSYVGKSISVVLEIYADGGTKA